tara:strand:+ start:24 stop:281 length:258 start_codon:yes stop_codon:yes gene_type:complete
MIKELKYLVYIFFILIFFFLILKYYFSEKYEKKYFKKTIYFEKNLNINLSELVILKNDTNNIIVFENLFNEDNNKKKITFWSLIK